MSKVHKFKKGVTITEAVVAGVVLVIGLLGAMSYQYHAVKQERMAWAELVAMRTGQMVIEDWKSKDGEISYTPENLDDEFVEETEDVWTISIDGLPMTITFGYNDVETNATKGITLRRLNVKVQWQRDYSDDSVDDDSPSFEVNSYVSVAS